MCGRFAIHAGEKEIIDHFHLKQGFSMRARYNLAPTQTIPIICEMGGAIEFARWGFLASWVKAEGDQIPLGHINARFESLAEKPSFRHAFKNQRCLIPASGYFEWLTVANKKHPYYVYLRAKPLIAFAGIWSFWKMPNGEMLRTCAIITMAATGPLQKFHERMPVIISPDNYALWLQRTNNQTKLEQMFVLPTQENVGIHAVSSRMSNPQFEGIECIKSL